MDRNDLRKLKRLRLTLNASNRIERLLKQLQAEFKDCLSIYEESKDHTDKACRTEVQAFIEVANKLREIKKRMAHGKWKDWVETNLKRSVKTAARWMRAAKWATANSETAVNILSVSQLMRACGQEQRQLATVQEAFSLAVALRLVKPLSRLNLEAVAALSPAEQQQLRATLQPAHELFLSLPAPESQTVPSQ